MTNLYCEYCGRETPHKFVQHIRTHEEEQKWTNDLYGRMERGEFGLFDVITAKVMRHKFVADIQQKVDNAFRSFGLDPGQDIEGKDMYTCTACSRVRFV